MSASGAAEAKRVGFLELFFDLVFVFAVTQLVALLHDDHAAAGWMRAGVVLWLIWWAWSQFTWAGNAIDLDHRSTRVAVLAAMAAMMVAATVIPESFSDTSQGLVLAVSYALVRFVGLGLYWFGLRDDPAHQAALRSYLPVQLASPLLVVAGGLADDRWRTALWAAAIFVDIASVIAAGRGEFRIDAAHFAERHGLIVIIALGETVIASGLTASGLGIDADVGLLLAIAFVGVAGLWWCYFDWVHAAAEARLVETVDHRRRAHLARDLFTFAHLPIVAGTVVFAVAVEEALLHPTERLDSFGITALAVGPAIYLAGFVAGNLRATGRLLTTRAIGLAAIVAAALTVGNTASATVAVAVVTVVIVAIAATETMLRRGHTVPTTPTAQITV